MPGDGLLVELAHASIMHRGFAMRPTPLARQVMPETFGYIK